jgi:hypothetical protein
MIQSVSKFLTVNAKVDFSCNNFCDINCLKRNDITKETIAYIIHISLAQANPLGYTHY